MSKVVIAAAVEAELAPFIERYGTRSVVFTGVGPVAAAFGVRQLAVRENPDLIIQAGICGCYEGSGLGVGEVVEVVRERLADLGAVRDGRFCNPFAEGAPIENPYRLPRGSRAEYPEVAGFTVSTAAGPLTEQMLTLFAGDKPAVESMEGFSLFYVCKQLGIPCAQLRAVSNRVGDDRARWNIPLATRNLADALTGVLTRLNAPAR
jgi:futalosine hydrolase